MNNNFLFIGAIGNDETIRKLNERGFNISTAYNVQRKILAGLEENGVYCDTITGHPTIPTWKKWEIICFDEANRNDNVTDIAVSFPNYPFLHRIVKTLKIGCIARKWVKSRTTPVLITYSLSSIFLLSALMGKRCNHKCIIISIVPDLPEYMRNTTNKLYWFLKRIDRHIIDYCLNHIDGFVLFTEHMKEKLSVGEKPYCVMEGILNVNTSKYIELAERRKQTHKKVIMLSGNLDAEEGILILLKAFNEIKDKECELWLTGSGNAQNVIEEYQKKDDRIKYYGYIASYREFLQLQAQATVFVLMVPPGHPKAPYYFPSKVMEYLAAGGIVVCFKLPCIPEEYDPYLTYLPNNPEDISCIADTLERMCNTDKEDLFSLAMERIPFLKTKCQKAQANKIINLVKCISKSEK